MLFEEILFGQTHTNNNNIHFDLNVNPFGLDCVEVAIRFSVYCFVYRCLYWEVNEAECSLVGCRGAVVKWSNNRSPLWNDSIAPASENQLVSAYSIRGRNKTIDEENKVFSDLNYISSETITDSYELWREF